MGQVIISGWRLKNRDYDEPLVDTYVHPPVPDTDLDMVRAVVAAAELVGLQGITVSYIDVWPSANDPDTLMRTSRSHEPNQPFRVQDIMWGPDRSRHPDNSATAPEPRPTRRPLVYDANDF